MKRVKVLLADDHDVVLQGLLHILDRPEFEIVGTVRDGASLVEAACKLKPDLILSDISMPSLSGIQALRQIRERGETPKILFLTMHLEVPYAVEALAAGASGYLLKNSAGDELLPAMQEVLRGRTYVATALRSRVEAGMEARSTRGAAGTELLTPRQREVLQLLAQGLHAKEIAFQLAVSVKTVEFHKQQMKRSLGVQTVAEMVAYAVSQGIVESFSAGAGAE